MGRTLFSKQEKGILLILASLQFSHIVDFIILMPLGPQLMRIFQITPAEFGWLVSIYTGAAAVASLLTSLFIDRFDRKSSLLFFSLGFVTSTIACALAGTYWFLFFARGLAGVFGGVIGTIVLAIVSDAIDYKRRGTAMGIMMGSFSLASIFGIPFSLFLAHRFSWHAPFLFLSGLSLMVTFLAAKIVPSQRAYIQKSKGDFLKPLRSMFESRTQIVALIFMSCLILGQFTIIPFLSPSLVANAGMKESELALIYLVGGLCSIISSPWIGRLSDRFGKHVVFRYGCLLSLIPILLITNLGIQPLWIILSITGSFFIAMGGRMIPAMAMISEVSAPENRGSFMSLNASVQQMSQAGAALLGGFVVHQDQSGGLQRYGYVGVIAVIFSLAAIALSRKIPRH